MKNNQRAKTLLNQKELHENKIRDLKFSKEVKFTSLKETMSLSWLWIHNLKLEKINKEISDEIRVFTEKKTKNIFAKEMKIILQKSISEKQCSTCEQDLSDQLIKVLQKKLQNSTD